MSVENKQESPETQEERFPKNPPRQVHDPEEFLVAQVHAPQYAIEKKKSQILKRFLRMPTRQQPVATEEVLADEVNAVYHQKLKEEEDRFHRVISNIVDFVPVVGSIKMALEGIQGKQFGTGKELHGVERGLHTVSGVSFLVLDLTGVGTIISEFGKGAFKIGGRGFVKVIEELLAHDIAKEGAILAARAEERMERKEKIQKYSE